MLGRWKGYISVSRCPLSSLMQSPTIAITFKSSNSTLPSSLRAMHPASSDDSPVESSSASTISSFEKPEDNVLTSVQTHSQDRATQDIAQINVLTRTGRGQNSITTLSIDANATTPKEFTRQLYECYGIKSSWKRSFLDWILMRETLVASALVTRVNAHAEDCVRVQRLPS